MTTISAEQAEELYESEDGETIAAGWSRITVVEHEARRWMQGHSLILMDAAGAYWSLDYDLGLTEEQPNELPWDSADQVRLTRVYPHEVRKVEYRTTPPEPVALPRLDGPGAA